eukprot:TRINITY_DN68487_c0_g1_i1.p1 TRINITY_DN68487_c0_g1~~TRINITY_DN68487_c0_g1_i1.p1  ORF type:complete len:314 (+),score=54.55 TRINITY_DN68487_c0_g1_i1:343-1284(+)
MSNELDASGSDSRPACEITIKGKTSWNSRQVLQTLDKHGSTRQREYYGITFKTTTKGKFRWFQMSIFIYLLTIGLAWLTLPFYIIFSFAMNFLGTLSEVFRGYIFEDFDVRKEVDGASARMMGASYSHEETSDIIHEHPTQVLGISKEQTYRRLEAILEHNKAFDHQARQRFMDFFFRSTFSEIPANQDEAITLADFLAAVLNNENLRTWDDVIHTLDPSGDNKNALEYIFADDTVKALSLPKAESSSDINIPRDSKDQLLNRLNLHNSLWVIQRCNLTRIRLGQEVVKQQVEKLQTAGEGLKEIATNLQGRY